MAGERGTGVLNRLVCRRRTDRRRACLTDGAAVWKTDQAPYLKKQADKGRKSFLESSQDIVARGRELYERGREIAEETAEIFERGRKIAEKTVNDRL